MSQSHHPTDTQALLQSMLQKLKLQPGREGQAYLKSPVTAASIQGQDVWTGAPSLQQVNNPVNVFGVNGELQRSATSLTSQNVNTDGGTHGRRALQQDTWLGVAPTTSGQLFPAQSQGYTDADFTSVERTDMNRETFSGFGLKRHIPPDTDTIPSTSPNQVQGFTSKIYLWSSKSTEADGSGHEKETLQTLGNSELGSLEPSKDTLIVPNSQNTTNSRRKQRSSEKTRRWTQKIKDRWKDRQGNLSKKGREQGGTADQMTEQGSRISTPDQFLVTQNVMNSPNEDGALDNIDSSKISPAQTDDDFFGSNIRSSSDSVIGFGSFSLLEEIIEGQEWAKFISPNFSANSVNQTPLKEPLNQNKNQLNPNNSSQFPGIFNQLGSGSNQWSFKNTESTPRTIFSTPQASLQAFASASMDVSEVVHIAETQPGLQLRPSSFAESAENPGSSAGKSRAQTSRKRQHQSAERFQTEINNAKEVDRGFTSAPNPTSYDMMDASGAMQQDNVVPLHALNLHPSPSNAFAPAPRGVLRHHVTKEAESPVETMTKRRRVEENRRVHFSEDVVTIPPSDFDAVDSDSESGSEEEEEDFVAEQECEVEQAVTEMVAPVRRTTLPAWILALKRKNTGRKHR